MDIDVMDEIDDDLGVVLVVSHHRDWIIGIGSGFDDVFGGYVVVWYFLSVLKTDNFSIFYFK